MNSAIHSSLNANRVSILRRSKAYRQKIFKRLLFGLPIVATIGWEYRVWKRKLYYNRNRNHFPGSTPFYGKMWGYESDYTIETSLNDGDLVFWAADPLSIHIYESVCRFAYRHLKGDYDAWDFCGIVKKVDGRAHVVGPHGEAVLYSDLVADHRTTSLAIRRIVDTSPGGESSSNIASALRVDSVSQNIGIGPLGFLEYSLKSVVCKYFPLPESRMHGFLLSLVRPSSRSFPLPLLSQRREECAEIVDVFMDPLVNKTAATSYSPPFFVRRVDNEYYNHNRTKNIVVDWELLTQRDLKNKIVSGHSRDNTS